MLVLEAFADNYYSYDFAKPDVNKCYPNSESDNGQPLLCPGWNYNNKEITRSDVIQTRQGVFITDGQLLSTRDRTLTLPGTICFQVLTFDFTMTVPFMTLESNAYTETAYAISANEDNVCFHDAELNQDNECGTLSYPLSSYKVDGKTGWRLV
mmetsp:Transcript_13444/g.15614  ORF Transcript_13444/g.15614 Transcript_13444/m.15614 type:complete len:153 (+) Transcript_13444:23-481(+)